MLKTNTSIPAIAVALAAGSAIASTQPATEADTIPGERPAQGDRSGEVPPELAAAQRPRFLFGEPGTVSFNAEAGFDWTMRGDLDDAPGDVGIFRSRANVGIAIPLSERSRLGFSVSDELSIYDFEGFELSDSPVDPLDEGNELSVSASFLHVFNDRWSFIGGGGFAWSGEFDAEFSSSMTTRGFAAGQYSFSRQLRIGAGGLFATRLDDDALIIPIVLIEWQPTDRVTVSNTAGGMGAGLEVAYELDEDWTASLQAGWQAREYRLSDDSVVPEGVFRDSRVPVSIGVRYQPVETILFELRAGANVYTEFELLNDDGGEVFSTEADPTGFIGFRVEFPSF